MRIENVGNRIMNTYVYPIATGYVMVDTGYENSMRSVMKKLNRRGIEFSEVRYVFLTHAHDDHAGFLNELLANFPHIKVVMHEKALPTLLKGQNSFVGGCSGLLPLAFCNVMKLLGKGEHRFPPLDKRYLDRLLMVSPQNIAALESELQGKILFTPGHTPDSLSLKKGGIVFCGDAAMNGLPSLKRVTIWITDTKEFQQSWDTLIAEKAERLYPAHGKPFRSNDLKKYKNLLDKITLYKLK